MMAATQDAPQMWLLARSSGLFAYAVLSCAVIAGLTLRSRMFGRTVPPAVITAIHQTLSTVGLLAVVLHAGLLVADTHIDIPLVAAFIPGLSGFAPVATAVGVIATELWVLIHLSFKVRQRIGVHRWRSLHKLTFVTWGLAAVHGVVAGSDTTVWWVQQMYTVSAAIVGALIAYRVLRAQTSSIPKNQGAAS